MSEFRVQELPDIDQREIKRGRCPWCLGILTPSMTANIDACFECDDVFVGHLTIDD